MVSIIIKDWNTGKLYGHVKTKKLQGILASEFLDVLNRSKDLFRLWGARSIIDTGIRKSQTSKNVIRNKPHDCRGEDFEPDFMGVIMDDGSFERTNIKLDITVYPRGYVLNVGMCIVSVLGTSNLAYLKCIGKRNAYRATLAECHVFPTVKSLLAYIEKHESVYPKFGGILYNLNEDAKKAITIVQKDGNFPYHVVVSHTMIGDMYAVLYASQDSTEWDSERLSDGSCLAYVYNATYPECSEYGSIGIQSANGGIIRTY